MQTASGSPVRFYLLPLKEKYEDFLMFTAEYLYGNIRLNYCTSAFAASTAAFLSAASFCWNSTHF